MTKEQVLEVSKNLKFQPMNQTILVIADKVSEKSKAGVIKDAATIEEEKKAINSFLDVVKVSSDIKDIEPGDRILPVMRPGCIVETPFIPAVEGKVFMYIKLYDVLGFEKA